MKTVYIKRSVVGVTLLMGLYGLLYAWSSALMVRPTSIRKCFPNCTAQASELARKSFRPKEADARQPDAGAKL